MQENKTKNNSNQHIYLDFNSTQPLRQEVKQIMCNSFDLIGNPSSVHTHGRKMRDIIEDARQRIAKTLKLDSRYFIFCSGATEANNLILLSFHGPVIVSAIEHPSILHVRRDAQICPVKSNGIICLDALESLLKKSLKNTLVCIMAANNETGIIQPIDEIAALVHSYDGFLHCDTVQAINRTPLCWQAIDSFVVSAHKLGGPFGIGLLNVNQNMTLHFPFKGGGQERSMRPGTENVYGIIGMVKAIELGHKESWRSVKIKRDMLEEQITTICPETPIIGQSVPRLPNTSMISMLNMDNTQQLIQFDLHGISVSNGSACSSGKVRRSSVLLAMNTDPVVARGAIRVSLGLSTTEEEIKTFVNTWYKIYTRHTEKKTIYYA